MPRQRQDDLAAARHAAADEAGVAALRDDGDAVLGAGAQHARQTSAVDPGRTTASAEPPKRRVQSIS